MSKDNNKDNIMPKETKKQTLWDKYKLSNPDRVVTPLDLIAAGAKHALGSKHAFVPVEIKESRMQTCRDCEHFQEKTVTCALCHCFLPGKTSLPHSFCPIGKWGKVEV